MGYVGEIGKRLTLTVTYVKSFDYVDYKFSYYGTTHYTHIFKDERGNTLVWKSTNPVEYVNDGIENPNRKGDLEFATEKSKVELTGTVKEHSLYKDAEQTVLTRCKFKLIERAKSIAEIDAERRETQLNSLGQGDEVWTMPYRQFKAHYSDCETIVGSYNDHTNSRGVPHGDPTIDVIIRAGRLKKSGVRGEHYSGFEFTTDDGRKICYRAISEETARKRMRKEYPDSDNWECTHIYNYRDTHKIW